ncbi:MAG: site-2 protease family protein [Acidobacteria bacterium]|nr:site-2 protease family protein [Acidobacteriota bacterium]MDW7983310.1 site-2 protease family protein [Acidobacteriota bacterium]
MSEERPEPTLSSSISPPVGFESFPTWRPPSGRMMAWSAVLFGLTFLTALVVGTYHMIAFSQSVGRSVRPLQEPSIVPSIFQEPRLLWMGLPYAVVLLVILLSHELGHYLFCWRYRVDATLPVFIPAPTLIGTFGAFIRIRGVIPHRNALLDIGVAGPLTGFLCSLPFLALGVVLSQPMTAGPPPTDGDTGIIYFGEPLIWKLLVWLLRDDPPGTDLMVHPIALAAWFGVLATNLNLFPIGQLDGGHVAYAVLGPRARWLSRAFWFGLAALAIHNFVWFAWTLMTLLIGFRHPPTLWDDRPLDGRRRWLALAAAGVFFLTFMPDPVRIHL